MFGTRHDAEWEFGYVVGKELDTMGINGDVDGAVAFDGEECGAIAESDRTRTG